MLGWTLVAVVLFVISFTGVLGDGFYADDARKTARAVLGIFLLGSGLLYIIS